MKNELCHYCDLNAFQCIIEKQTIWLSDIHFLNDSSEESLFLDALSDVMSRMLEKVSNSTREHINENNDIKTLFTNIKHLYENVAYICCFSDNMNDDLSQWRGYADDGKGMCIGFHKEQLSELSKPNMKQLKPDGNIYNQITDLVFQQKKICYSTREAISKELEGIISPIIKDYDSGPKTGDIIHKFPDILFYGKLRDLTYNNRVFYKNSSFKSENEYRICFYDYLHKDQIESDKKMLMTNMQTKYEFSNGTKLSELKYRKRASRLIPFREMKFPKTVFQQMLSSITIGPKNPMSKDEVEYFLLANGFDTSNISIKKSESTYQ